MSMAEFMVLRHRVTALEAVVAALQARLEAVEQEPVTIAIEDIVAQGMAPAIVKRGPGRPRKDGNPKAN